mgnify:CR=1 FL=1
MLSTICPVHDPNLLVGFETCVDAALYRVSPDVAIISTVDFITPPVDDPVWFGRIAAANALSDDKSRQASQPAIAADKSCENIRNAGPR